MKIIITETQYESLSDEKKYFFRRNYNDLNIHLSEIIQEGFWHYEVCDYTDFKTYYDLIVGGSVETFIYSYDELGGYNDDSMTEYLTQHVRDKFGNYIKQEWRDRECD